MSLARSLYTLLGCAVLPWLPLRLWWRGRREPGYRMHIGERFGRYALRDVPASGPVFWVHAVSVGETRAAAPLVQRLRGAHCGATIVMTHMTATGREAGQALFGGEVTQVWLPYDLPFAVRAFYRRFKPLAGFLLETELWPNLIAEGRSCGVALYLINARLSQRSASRYARFTAITRPMLGALAGVAAQSEADAGRLSALGAPTPLVTGNLKFDVTVPHDTAQRAAALRLRLGAGRRIWVAGSTREGEEALILDALARRPLASDTLLVIVPRHPQRFAAVAELLQARSIPFIRRSDADRTASPDVAVVLGDSMGEMPAYYAAADLAFVGGSLLPLGGQNFIEALAVGTPVLIGPHTFNFADASAGATEAGAARRVADARALIEAVASLLADDAVRAAMGRAARDFHARHAGATDRLWGWLAPRLLALKPKA
ncbi:MAG TPA: lipid IV(A) 3-deoxy-D-manno-octulosonic acid transferase [Casimicrobiaceae bacterium]|nr:lipid IV(A) 3-deoxy-D-manno-octulosonic acid transferase [Casimicrobiaceae bacterium]